MCIRDSVTLVPISLGVSFFLLSFLLSFFFFLVKENPLSNDETEDVGVGISTFFSKDQTICDSVVSKRSFCPRPPGFPDQLTSHFEHKDTRNKKTPWKSNTLVLMPNMSILRSNPLKSINGPVSICLHCWRLWFWDFYFVRVLEPF